VVAVYFIKSFINKYLTKYLLINDLETKYKMTSKKKRFLNFVIAIFLTAGAVMIFGCSLFLLKWL
jgi:predicted HTH transcriptional regulator